MNSKTSTLNKIIYIFLVIKTIFKNLSMNNKRRGQNKLQPKIKWFFTNQLTITEKENIIKNLCNDNSHKDDLLNKNEE